MSKGTAFVMCYIAIVFIFCAMGAIGVLQADLGAIPAGACLTALCSITAGYIGLQVANNGVRGHYWNPELYAEENKKEGKHDGTQRNDAGGTGPAGPSRV